MASTHRVIATMFDDRIYIVLDLSHLGLWRKLCDCLGHHFTVSQCVLKCALLTFLSISNRLAEIWGLFHTLFSLGEVTRKWHRGYSHSVARQWVPISSPLRHNGLSLAVLDLFNWLEKRNHSPARTGYDDNYHSGSYCFYKWQQEAHH